MNVSHVSSRSLPLNIANLSNLKTSVLKEKSDGCGVEDARYHTEYICLQAHYVYFLKVDLLVRIDRLFSRMLSPLDVNAFTHIV